MSQDRIDVASVVVLPSDASGGHWSTMAAPDVALREFAHECAATLRLACGDATADDLELLEVEVDSLDDGNDAAYDVVNACLLDARVARWERDSESPEVAAAMMLLGTGGPHVEVNAGFGVSGRCERVELEQHWSGTRRAVTYDAHVCEIVSEYIRAFLTVDS